MRIILLILAFLFTASEARAMLCPSDFHSDGEMVDFVKKASLEETVSSESGFDINQHGKNDRLIGVTCGNAGCEYYVFLQQAAGSYSYAGHAFFHKDAFKVLSETGGFGILAYVRENAETGTLVRYLSNACQIETLTKMSGAAEQLDNFVKDFPQPPS